MNSPQPKQLATLGLLVMSSVLPTLASAAEFTVIDGEGFEAPDYALGQLETQFASTDGGMGAVRWLSAGTTASTAVVQDTVFLTGSQAVRVDRAANEEGRWFVPVDGFPSVTRPLVVVDWDMRVEEATGTGPNSFGPFFGVETYDNEMSFKRLGTVGVDAATGDVLAIDRASGFIATGEVVNFAEWNNFRIVLDYTENEYMGFLNGEKLFVEPIDFEAEGASQFSEADISAIGAAGDAGSLSAIGTAYFDNYFVFETDDRNFLVPEPASMVLLSLGGVMLLGRRRVAA